MKKEIEKIIEDFITKYENDSTLFNPIEYNQWELIKSNKCYFEKELEKVLYNARRLRCKIKSYKKILELKENSDLFANSEDSE